MKIIAADGEAASLEKLERLISECIPTSQTVAFSDVEEVPGSPELAGAEIVFLGVPRGKCNSVDVARRIHEAYPSLNIVFCADKADHALDAFGIGASDYLMKPLTAEKLAHAMQNLRYPPAFPLPEHELYVRCFGEFEVFWNGKPLLSLTRRAKELFAFLVDRQGAECDAKEVIDVLFKDMSDVNFRIACKNLREALEEIGKGEILFRRWGKIAVDMDAFFCDCTEYLRGNLAALSLYKGSYMSQYPWTVLMRDKTV